MRCLVNAYIGNDSERIVKISRKDGTFSRAPSCDGGRCVCHITVGLFSSG